MEGAAKTQWSCNVLTPQTHQLQRSTLPLPWTSGPPGPFLRLTYSFEKKAFESRVLHNKNDTRRLDTIFFFCTKPELSYRQASLCTHTKGQRNNFQLTFANKADIRQQRTDGFTSACWWGMWAGLSLGKKHQGFLLHQVECAHGVQVNTFI